MSYLAQHIRTRLSDGRVIASTAEERRLAMRSIFRLARDCHLLAVALVDAHLHLLALCSTAFASRLVRRIEISLKRRLALPVGFVMYPHEPVRDARHLRNAFRYVLRQLEHHGLRNDPYHESTNLPDLLGLRLIGAYTRENVQRWLPRVTRAHLVDWIGARRLEPADDPVREIEPALKRATALDSWRGKSPPAVQARTAAIHVYGDRLPASAIAERLGITTRSVYRLRGRAPDVQLVRAVRLQLGMHSEISDRARRPSLSPPGGQ